MTAPPTTATPLRAGSAAGWLGLPVRLGRAIYGLLTSVRFAVVQIIAIALAGVVGTIIPQLPGIAFRSPADYAERMEILRARIEPALGPVVVDALEALGFVRVFSAGWFTALLAILVISIVACTIDRTPRLWRAARELRVVQPRAFFDPDLPGRAFISGGLAAGDVRAALQRARFGVREEVDSAGVHYVYGDRNRYASLFTLITHAGLVGFILAGAVSSRFGFEAGLLLVQGQAIPVAAIGTPDLVHMKNLNFSAPRDEEGRFLDFATELAVFQGGREIARQTIRVNEPLSAAGFTFHQNFFGPAVDLTIRDGAGGLLWAGPIPLDYESAGQPYGRFMIPGREEGLELLLGQDAAGGPSLAVVGYRVVGEGSYGEPVVETTFVGGASPGRTYVVQASDLWITFEEVTAYSGVIVRRDPGAPIAWFSFGLLIVGLALTFYFPRRRVWARLEPDGELRLVARADRDVELRREFSSLLEDLVARRRTS
jgi:cytochrome c biogenesis protein